MTSLPPLAAVRAFEAAARHGNFSRAAEELALTQAGVSYQIKLLEERLDARLFVRRGRTMELTALGQRIAPRVIEAFGLLGEAFADARAENESVLSITCPRSFATNWLAGRLGAFQLLRPDIAVRLDVSDTLIDLSASEFDVAIRGVARPEAGLVAHLLMRQMVTPMASPEFLARHPVDTPQRLREVPRISPGDEWWDLWFGSLTPGGADQAEPRGVRFEWQVLDGQAAIAGHGVAVVSPFMFQRAIAAGQLVQLFPHAVADHRSIWLVYPEHKRRLAKVRAFREWLLESLRESIGDDPLGILEPPEE